MRHAIFASLGSAALVLAFPALVLVFAALLLVFAAPVRADDADSSRAEARRSAAEILAPLTEAPEDQGGFLDHVHIKKKRGFAYTRPVSFGSHDMSFSVAGPSMGKARVGLIVELKF